MVSYHLATLSIVCSVFAVSLGSNANVCPRHRGLSEGLTRKENKIKDRALYRLDLRNAITGYVPNKIYRFRVHTTSRKHKFNDATAVLDALDRDCGIGKWIIETEKLYTPVNCSEIVATQEKEPMGRAHFKWQAPSCGCVHIRVRVHSNSVFYLEDESEANGPLARTICPKQGELAKESKVDSEAEVERLSVKQFSRDERFGLLCDVSLKVNAVDLLNEDQFIKRRNISDLNGFELERLQIAVHQRHSENIKCCEKKDNRAMHECFGDVRRRRIDMLCATGEPDIPFAQDRYNWMARKRTECCFNIGEERYDCFNSTRHQEGIQNDGKAFENVLNLDDLDPANDIEDYPKALDIKSTIPNSESHSEQDQAIEVTNVRHKSHHGKLHDKAITSVTHTTNEDSEAITSAETKDVMADTTDTKQDIPAKVTLSEQECSLNGIDAGFRLKDHGFEMCFHEADKFKRMFDDWHINCDRNFVIHCMRVIDRLSKRHRCIHSIKGLVLSNVSDGNPIVIDLPKHENCRCSNHLLEQSITHNVIQNNLHQLKTIQGAQQLNTKQNVKGNTDMIINKLQIRTKDDKLKEMFENPMKLSPVIKIVTNG